MRKLALNSWSLCGALLVLPLLFSGCTSTGSAPIKDSSLNSSSSSAPGAALGGATHTVRAGETLLAIARQHGLSARDLAAWNGITNPNQIHVGQELRLSASGTVNSGVESRPIGTDAPEAVEVRPVASAGAAGGSQVKGGKVPYSDSAWSQAQGAEVNSVPAPVKPLEEHTATAGTGEWIWPVNGRMISAFSDASKGIDVAAKAGDPVLAARAGKVAYAGSGLRGYGKLVIVSHEGEFLSAYAHNQSILVKEGDTVTQGQKIAEVGNTDTDRVKLHFEIRRQGRPIDPTKFLPAR